MNTQYPWRTTLITGLCLIMVLLLPCFKTHAALPVDWQNWSTQELLDATNSEAWATLTVDEQRTVTNHVWSSYLSDGGEASGVGLSDFIKLSEQFQGRLDTAQRTSLNTQVRARMANSGEDLTSLDVLEVLSLRKLSTALSIDKTVLEGWTRTYLENSPALLNQAGPVEITLLLMWVDEVENVLAVDMSTTRRQIENYVDSLGTAGPKDAHAIATEVRLIEHQIKRAGPDQLGPYVQQLSDLITQNRDGYLGLGTWDILHVRWASEAAGLHADTVHDWTLDWILNSDTWLHKSTYVEINALYGWIFAARTRPMAHDAERRLTDYLRDRLMIDPSVLVADDNENFGLTRVVFELIPRLDDAEAQTLAAYVADRFLSRPDLDGDHWDYEKAAAWFTSPQLRQELHNRLLDTQGRPRVKIGELLTWSYCGSDQLDNWRTAIDQNVNDTRFDSDTRALWLLIRAEAASPWALPADTLDKTPRELGEQAFHLAGTENTKLECLKWIIQEDLRMNRAEAADAILTNEASILTSPEVAEEIQELGRKVSLKLAGDS